MKDVGVGGVLLFDIGIHPQGNVGNRSPEWYNLVKLAVNEANRNGIKVGFHCPGWSASGGPWITPDRGMQELTWSEVTIEGPRKWSDRLPQPPMRLEFYRDAAVFAFPTPEGDTVFPMPKLTATDGDPLTGSEAVFAANTATAVRLPSEFDLVYPNPVEVRSIFVRAARGGGRGSGKLLAWDEAAGGFHQVAVFRALMSGPFSEQIGCASFAPAKAARFRLVFDTDKPGDRVTLQRLELTQGFRVTDWPSKAGFATEAISARPHDVQPRGTDAIPPDRVIDLTEKFAGDGSLAWSVPAGRWTIVRLGYTPTGVHIAPAPKGGDGLECDKLSKETADFHYDRCVTPVLHELGPDLCKQALAYYHVDSYEAGWQNWTENFPQQFKARRNYDLRRYLPSLTGRVVGDIAMTERFLWDFRRTIGDLYADNHYGRLAERCHADGLGFSTEPYGGPFEFLQVGLRADHPMIEFWLPTNPLQNKFHYESVSVGHSGERSIIGAESFTSGPPEERWNSHPFSLKALGDFIYCCGVNRYVIHVSAHQPLIGEHLKPGFTCGCNGIHFDRNNTWWDHGAKEWLQYLTRCQSLLQAGEPIADALYFLGNDSPYGCGPFDPAPPEGYDYDACNSEILEKLKVQDGQIMLPKGKRYCYLVLPSHGRVTLASLRKIAALASNGATFVGRVPTGSPSLADAASADEYARLAGELAGCVKPGSHFERLLAADRVSPDFSFDEESGMAIHFAHRRVGNADVYFVANASQRAGTVDCRFRISGKEPQFWRPDTGVIEPCPVYTHTETGTRIPLRFDPAGSMFVVFEPGQPKPHALELASADTTSAGSAPALTICKATYGVPGRTVDVTSKLAARVSAGKLKFGAFSSLAGDPAPGIVKRLCVEYETAGKSGTAELRDGDTLRLPPPIENQIPCELRADGEGLKLRACEAGRFAVTLPNQRTEMVAVDSVPAPQLLSGPWALQFPAGWGAPEQTTFDRLISWPNHSDAGIRYFAGTATYRMKFQAAKPAPGSQIELDLGRVEVIAEVWLNGKSLGTLWKPPFACDVTGDLRSGENELEVHVTNLWPNRIIGDQQFPDDLSPGRDWGGIPAWPEWLRAGKPRPEPRRLTFYTWNHWKKDEPLLPSGLIGPVMLRCVKSVRVP